VRRPKHVCPAARRLLVAVDENGKSNDDPDVFSRVVLLVVAAAGVGCGSSTGAPPIDANPPPPPPPLSLNGCFDGSNAAGIIGCWYSYADWYGDGAGAPAGAGDCGSNMANLTADQCSSVTAPVPGQPFAGNSGAMCTSGTAAKVIDMASSAIWGAGIGFDFNNAGTADGGVGEKLPWDATAHNVTGFAFHIDTPPVGGQMRVEFPTSAAVGTTDIKPAYWLGATNNLSPIKNGGDYAFHFADVGGPMALTAPMPFDKTKILSMHFHVVSNTTSVIPFSYCISNVTLLQD
jgi:hypothetical protein